MLQLFVEFIAEPCLRLLLGLLKSKFEFTGFFFQVVDLLLKNLNVQFKLLFNANVFSNFRLRRLQLLLVLLRREIQGLKRTREVRLSVVIPITVMPLAVCLLLLFVFQMHQNLN